MQRLWSEDPTSFVASPFGEARTIMLRSKKPRKTGFYLSFLRTGKGGGSILIETTDRGLTVSMGSPVEKLRN
jgi:hypothetical protein